jgi:hypothetical protein
VEDDQWTVTAVEISKDFVPCEAFFSCFGYTEGDCALCYGNGVFSHVHLQSLPETQLNIRSETRSDTLPIDVEDAGSGKVAPQKPWLLIEAKRYPMHIVHEANKPDVAADRWSMLILESNSQDNHQMRRIPCCFDKHSNQCASRPRAMLCTFCKLAVQLPERQLCSSFMQAVNHVVPYENET